MTRTARQRQPHEDCRTWDPCEEGTPSSCPREPMRELRRKAMEGAWSQLELRREAGGLRYYLDGEPLHAGEGLDLQAREERYDGDGNGYSVPLNRAIPVRYEASQDGRKITATLYHHVDGYTFAAGYEEWMRFRWPARRWGR